MVFSLIKNKVMIAFIQEVEHGGKLKTLHFLLQKTNRSFSTTIIILCNLIRREVLKAVVLVVYMEFILTSRISSKNADFGYAHMAMTLFE